MNVEEKVKKVIQKVLDVNPQEIKADVSLDKAYGVDSTEMVEISVGIKKEVGVAIGDNELKKTHSLNEILNILKSKTANAGHSHGPNCGCSH